MVTELQFSHTHFAVRNWTGKITHIESTCDEEIFEGQKEVGLSDSHFN